MAYNDDYLDEIHEAASQKNYKALLQNDIARYNMKLNEQKYLENSLASQGFASQGYGSTAHIGVENQAANLYAQNQENYNQTEQDLLLQAQERKKADATEQDNQLATFLQYSDGSDEAISRYMGNYGYTKNEEGKWVDKDGKEASPYILSSVQSASENSAYNKEIPDYSNSQTDEQILGGAQSALKSWVSSYTGVDANGYASVDALRSATVGNKDNTSSDKLDNIVHFELNKLAQGIANGNIKNGTLIRLQRSGGNNEAYLVLYIDGKLYVVSDDDREEEGNQVATRYNQYQGPKTTIKGW